MCGVKANFATVGVTAKVKLGDCEAAKVPSNRPPSIVKWTQDAGKATGVVTATQITDASPAGAYAHVPFRHLECDNDVHKYMLDPKSCNFDIASQLVYDEPGRSIKVKISSYFSIKKFILSLHAAETRISGFIGRRSK